MEGQKDQNDIKINHIAIAAIIFFHLISLAGFLIPVAQPYFIRLIPFHILLMFSIIVFSYNADVKRLFLFVTGIFLCGFLVEVLGVHTGKIFGSFYYGDTLGYKIAAVPLLMGVNWVILIYSVGQMMKSLKIRNSILASLLGAFILVLFDFFLEPVAMKFNYWQWDWHQIPVQNYVAWFIVSLIFLKFYYALGLKQQKNIGLVMFLAQLLFFVVLYVTVQTNIFA